MESIDDVIREVKERTAAIAAARVRIRTLIGQETRLEEMLVPEDGAGLFITVSYPTDEGRVYRRFFIGPTGTIVAHATIDVATIVRLVTAEGL